MWFLRINKKPLQIIYICRNFHYQRESLFMNYQQNQQNHSHVRIFLKVIIVWKRTAARQRRIIHTSLKEFQLVGHLKRWGNWDWPRKRIKNITLLLVLIWRPRTVAHCQLTWRTIHLVKLWKVLYKIINFMMVIHQLYQNFFVEFEKID